MDTQTSAIPVVSVEEKERIVRPLLEWYRQHRRDLPWRGASPYAVWVSEIMLQQTQVATVIPFFNRFLQSFPVVESLAAAPVEEVLKHWAGLGYYARARNLHRAAQIVVARHGGRLPKTPVEIETLPGIGRYTAGAILSIAYGVPRPIVDANVIRVLSRVFGLRGDPKSAVNQAALWSLAEQLVPADAPGDFNQGMMELGALVCDSSDPKCERCPLLPVCAAGNSAEPASLPEYPAGRTPVNVHHSSAIIHRDTGEFLIIQRPMHGLWGGLWEFPRLVCQSGEEPREAANRAAKEIVGLDTLVQERLGVVKHGVTHHRITLHGFLAALNHPEQPPVARECADFRWAASEQLQEFAFSSPQALLRDQLREFLTKKSAGICQPLLPHLLDFE